MKSINTKYTVGDHFLSIWNYSINNVLSTIDEIYGVDRNGYTQCLMKVFYNPKSEIHHHEDGKPILIEILTTIEALESYVNNKHITHQQFLDFAKEFGINIDRDDDA